MTNDPPTITAFAKDIEILQNFLRYLQGWESGNLLDQRIREILP